jgi:2,4-diaminopentanoate dehydrogenase
MGEAPGAHAVTSGDRYTVVQWATGNIGSHALRAVGEHPDLDLVGLYVFSEDKAGRDAGDIAGTPPTGVIATRDIGDILALGPDCVLYMADRVDVDALCLLLDAGINVVSTRSEFHNPDRLDPETRRRIEAACVRGGASLHSTGSSPGFITEALPLVLASLQRRLDHLLIEEFADMSSRNSPELIFDLMGFGRDPARFDPAGVEAHGGASFAGSLEVVAEALSLPLDSVVASGQVATARHDVDVAAGHLAAGTIGAQRMQVRGIRHGRPLLTFSANWYLTADVEPAWDLRETGWHLLLEGDTPLDVDIRFPVPPEEWATTSPGLTAHRPVNAIPSVCAAEPGIRTIVDLPQVIARLG